MGGFFKKQCSGRITQKNTEQIMVQVFDPKVKDKGDLYEVSQFGWLDIAAAYETGVVTGSLEGLEASMNNIDDPASIMGKPSDIFEAYRMKDYITKSAQKGAQSVSEPISPKDPMAYSVYLPP